MMCMTSWRSTLPPLTLILHLRHNLLAYVPVWNIEPLPFFQLSFYKRSDAKGQIAYWACRDDCPLAFLFIWRSSLLTYLHPQTASKDRKGFKSCHWYLLSVNPRGAHQHLSAVYFCRPKRKEGNRGWRSGEKERKGKERDAIKGGVACSRC